MIVSESSFRPFNSLEVWWPEGVESVYPLLSRAAVVTVMQCNDAVADALGRYAFRRKPFHTLLVDLSQSEQQLWNGIHRGDRSDINKAKKMDCRIVVNEEAPEAFRFVNEFIRRKRYRDPISWAGWRRMLRHSDVLLAKQGERILACHVVLVDYPARARLLLAATADRNDSRYHRAIGPLHRFLVWSEFNHYKARGICWYDLGGIVLDKTSPLYPISQFKLSFGGSVINENTVRLARNPVVRSLLRGVVNSRLMLLSMAGWAGRLVAARAISNAGIEEYQHPGA